MTKVSDVLEVWMTVQRSWLYLQPIFESPDINRQLPSEGKKFATVDKSWRTTLSTAKGRLCVNNLIFCNVCVFVIQGDQSNIQVQKDLKSKDIKTGAKVIDFCDNEKLLERFKESEMLLEQVQKGLSDYLETKRSIFARFYFLSNDELLSILSESKDVRLVQPHLKVQLNYVC